MLCGAPTEGKLFLVSNRGWSRHNQRVIGPFLNGFGILLGALFGLARREPLTLFTQKSCQSALAALTAFCGLQLVWTNVSGGFGTVIKQLFLAVLAMGLGFLLGKILGLQKISNRLGRRAAEYLTPATALAENRPSDSFRAATLIYCAAPMGWIGALTDGLDHYFFPLAVKAAMDGLAMASLVKSLRWPVALSAIPVYLFLAGLAWLAQYGRESGFIPSAQIPPINIVAGLILCAITLIILQVRRVEIANYLPALALAPVLAHWLG